MLRDEPANNKPIASEAGHWYDREGNPVYTVPRADGKGIRNTTLRDARKLMLAPSVSGIISMAAKPGLDKWKQDQMMEAARLICRLQGEDQASFDKRTRDKADEISSEARRKGTEVHAAVEQYYSGVPFSGDYSVIVDSVASALVAEYGISTGTVEKSFYHPSGYGGKPDMYGPNLMIDFKTKKYEKDVAFNNPAVVKKFIYDEHPMQLGAYRRGVDIPHALCINVFINVAEGREGEVAIYEHSEEDIKIAEEKFDCLLQYWKLTKNYESGET